MPLSAAGPVQQLSAGARVALVAPAGGLRGSGDVERAIGNARSLGWEPVVGEHALEESGYFAGSDPQRLHDLSTAISDPRVDGVWCIRGGYGTVRLLPQLNLPALAPKPVIGFSDVTALHSAIQKAWGVVSYHGPVARAHLSEFSRDSLVRAVVRQVDSCGVATRARVLRSGATEGVLAGGNLAVLTALVGTPYAPDLDGSILVLEDIGERTYRVDRMFQQLLLSGLLSGCRAIVFGECTDCPEHTESGSRSLDEVLTETASHLGIPCIAGVPIGHIEDQWTIPLGARAHLDAGNLTLTVLRD